MTTADLLRAAWPFLAGLSLLLAFWGWWKWRRWNRWRLFRLADVDRMDPNEFEVYVGKLLKAQGYKVVHTGGPGDFGRDLKASRDGRSVAVQCKRYSAQLDWTPANEAHGGKVFWGHDEAWVVTNNYFKKSARVFARVAKVRLVDRDELARWIERVR